MVVCSIRSLIHIWNSVNFHFFAFVCHLLRLLSDAVKRSSFWSTQFRGFRAPSSSFEPFEFVGFQVFAVVVTTCTVFWDITPCSPLKKSTDVLKKHLHLQNRLCLLPCFTLVFCSAYSSTLKTEAICSSETWTDFQRPTRRYIPVNSALHFLVWLWLERAAEVTMDACDHYKNIVQVWRISNLFNNAIKLVFPVLN
jgi:hypothetical protein